MRYDRVDSTLQNTSSTVQNYLSSLGQQFQLSCWLCPRGVYHVSEDSRWTQQISWWSHLGYSSILHNDNNIVINNCVQPMSNRQQRRVGKLTPEHLLHWWIRHSVARRCCFIQHKGSIKIPSVRIIQQRAFSHCYKLTNVEFGIDLKRIECHSFHNCTHLQRIVTPLKGDLIFHHVSTLTRDGRENWRKLFLEQSFSAATGLAKSVQAVDLASSTLDVRLDGDDYCMISKPGEPPTHNNRIRRYYRSLWALVIKRCCQ